jgi:glutaminyl-peptide cyclotransferase
MTSLYTPVGLLGSTRISQRRDQAPIGRIAVTLACLFVSPARASAAQPQTVRPEIVATYPHDSRAFTQGLVFHQGKLYESTGLLGRSTLRRVVPSTGVVEHSTSLAADQFGEGLALVGDRFFVLTWQNQVVLTYDLDFAPVGRFDYTGEGWGLCYDGRRLVMSDGSSRLFFRNPATFAIIGEVEVRGANGPVPNLNELECVGSLVYANVWQTNAILRIDPSSGDVTGTVDASGLLTSAEAASVDVLNGIAFNPTTGHFFITGKLWPKLFEVRFAFANAPTPDAGGANGGTGNAGGSSGTTGGSNGNAGDRDSETPAVKEPRARSGCGCTQPVSRRKWPGTIALGIAFLVLARRRKAA